MKLTHIILAVILLPLLAACASNDDTSMPSRREERKLILEGNAAFESGEYQKAANSYRNALKENPVSPEALYNNALATMTVAQQELGKQGSQPDSASLQMQDEAIQMYMKVAILRERATGIAALACYNLGNHYFRTDKLDEAEQYYRQSLRLSPDFDEARRNLRITQLKKKQNKDKDKDKKQQKEQNQDQQQKQQQQKNKNEQQDKKNQQPKQQQSNMTQQAAQQILNANNNKEQSTRARIEHQRQQQRQQGGGRGKRW